MRWRTVVEFEREGRTMLVRRPEGDRDAGTQFVLVHGIGVSSRYFSRLARVLARSGGVHAVDLPGFGRAPRPPEPLTVEQHAATVNAYVRSASLGRPVLVGHSMGSQIVVEAALQDPQMYSSVVAMGTVVDPAARTAPRQALRLARDTLMEPPLANWAVLLDYARTGPRWYLRTLPTMLGYRTEEAVRRLAVPLLLLRGARDPVAPHGWVEQLRRLAARARLVEVEGAAHVVMYSRPEQVAREIVAHAGIDTVVGREGQ